MSQMAQQSPLILEITGGISDATTDQKKQLKAWFDQGVIMDVILETTTEGTSKIVGTYVSGKTVKVIACDCSSTPALEALTIAS